MSKVIVTGDWHANNFRDFSNNVLVEWDDEIQRFQESQQGYLMNSRLLCLLDAICDMRDYADTHRIRNIIVAGDMFHTRGVVSVNVINALKRVFQSFPQMISVYAIAGNHDQIDSSVCPESILRSMEDSIVKTCETPTLLEIRDKDSEINLVALVPYSKSKEFIVESVNSLLSEADETRKKMVTWKPPIIVAHAGIDGGVAGSGMYSMKDTYSLSDFQPDRFRFCVFGHYHQPQFLSDNAIYCGSLIQNDFGDEREGYDNSANNGFWVIDMNKSGRDAFTFVPSNSPRFITISDKEELKKYDPDVIEKAHIRIRSKESESEEIKEAIQEAGNMDAPKMEVSVESRQVVRSGISIQSSAVDAVKTYANENGADKDTLAIGLEILGAVLK